MTDKTGGAAFPASGHPDMQFVAQEGMTLRDYFAAKAMNAMISTIPHPHSVMNEGGDENYWLAKLAYKTADAMLKARG